MQKRFIYLLLITLTSWPFITFANVFSTNANNQDLWYALRQTFNLPLHSQQDAVQKQIKWIQDHPTYISRLSQRAEPYLFFISDSLKKRGMPGEIALLPMIESAYNPFAYSPMGAAGLWQIMPGTGTGLGVRQDWWWDGRRAIHQSTKAALDYLQYLNNFFDGNWTLALAAYDSGEGTVQRAIKAKNTTASHASFWQLKLPRETRAYVPRLMALALVIKYPKYYGIELPPIANQAYFTKIDIDSQIDLNHAANLAEMNYVDLIKLNPGYNRWATSPNRSHTLVLPLDKVEVFKTNLAQIPSDKRVTWQRHLVKPGESLGLIAQQHRTTIKLIKKINRLKTNTIKINQPLLIPGTRKLASRSIIENQRHQAINRASSTGPRKVIHIVQKGETINSLERKYFTKAAAIRFWNHMNTNTIVPGQKLILWQRRSRAKTYVIKSGDSLSVIAKRHHMSLARLKRLNPGLKDHLIKPKQSLRIN